MFDCRSSSSAAMQTWVGGGREVGRGTHYGVAEYEMLEIENCEAQQEMLVELKVDLAPFLLGGINTDLVLRPTTTAGRSEAA